MDTPCHKTWEALTPTKDVRVRHCHECNQSVHLCLSDIALRRAAAMGLCVATTSDLLLDMKAEDMDVGSMRIGQVLPGHLS
ncbi:hypothetical protein [Chitinimonas sp.]|uniref:hypothetical protein n=1 Tax=Chitinimonas sp. TaxID=1934313 RepID=UPI002F94E8A7